jgi:hypothetical protein
MQSAIRAAGGAHTKTGWAALWQNNLTLWDLEGPTPALLDEVTTALADGRLSLAHSVLVPGCGAAYDVRALADKGFARVVGADITEEAIARATTVVGDAPTAQLLCADFFCDARLEAGSFHFIFDYTMFCAITPGQRAAWGARMAALLAPGGRLLTLAFPLADDAEAADPEAAGPPHPVSEAAYRRALAPHGLRQECAPRASPLTVPWRAVNEAVIWWVKDA